MIKSNHCIVLPTDRECSTAIKTYYREALFAKEYIKEDVPLVILDSSSKKCQNKHSEIIGGLNSESKIQIIYLNQKAQENYIKEIILKSQCKNQSRVYQILSPKDCSYGAAANKTFLIAASLCSKYLHRRDSDTKPQIYRDRDIFPIEIELRCFRKDNLSPTADISSDKPIFMVGGNYTGQWSLDLKEIYDYNPKLLCDYYSLCIPGKGRKAIKKFIEEKVIKPSFSQYSHDYYSVCYLDKHIIEVGNHALHNIFFQLPVIPATNSTGTDYFFHTLLHIFNLPVIYHNRQLIHYHTPERFSLSYFFGYHLKIVKFLVFSVYLNKICDKLIVNSKYILDEEYMFNNEKIGAIIQEFSINLLSESSVIIRKYAELIKKIHYKKYQQLYTIILEKENSLIDQVKQDLKDFSLLIKTWPILISAASKIML